MNSPKPFAPRSYGELHKVTDSVFIFRNITNSSFVVGSEAVAVIDTQVNGPAAAQLLAAVRSVTNKPIRYVVNTHYHWDHTNGNQLFKNQWAVIVSSKLTKEFMAKRQDRQKEFLAGRGFELGEDPLGPDRTFEGETILDLGDMPLELFFAGRAETDDATAVHVPKENVLMSGDTVMTGSFPIFGQPVWDEGLQGDSQWIQTIQKLMSLKPSCVIPGHGPLAHEADVELLIRIQRYFIEEVKKRVEKGLDVTRVLADMEPRLPEWITRMPIVWGTPRYAILRVFRGLTRREGEGEPGWQWMKPSAIPSSAVSCGGKETLADFIQMAAEAREGGDAGLELAILRKATELFSQSADSWAAYADTLIEASKKEPSVLEKGDFFQLAKTSWERALSLDSGHVGALLGKGRYWTMMAYRGGDNPRPGMALLERVVAAAPGGRAQAEAEFYLGMGRRVLASQI